MRTYDQLVRFFGSKGRDTSPGSTRSSPWSKNGNACTANIWLPGGNGNTGFLDTQIPYASEVEKMGIRRGTGSMFSLRARLQRTRIRISGLN